MAFVDGLADCGGLKPHPWYGPCDALGPNGECAECLKWQPGVLTVVPRELNVVERFRLIEIAHETSNSELREFALSLLRPLPTISTREQ